MKNEAEKKPYLDSVNGSRAERMRWWHEMAFDRVPTQQMGCGCEPVEVA